TLGMVELVFACSLMFPGFFGGEGGISTNRVIGKPILGISFGPQIEVYYLIAIWLFISAVGMYAFTQTPLGRLINAVRDNPERVEFIGYNTQWVRYLTLILSAFFAGISGALSAINFEIVSAENVSAIRSGGVLLFTFIGGIGFFFGPMIGAILGVLLTVILSDLTKAWQLYLGIFFILVVMYAPGGIASILMMNLRVLKFGLYKKIWPSMWKLILACAVLALGAVISIEMLYQISLEGASAADMQLFGVAFAPAKPAAWIVPLMLMLVGGLSFLRLRPSFARDWGEANTDIQEQLRRSQA
ncbi:MAG: branched-chain amino acid ABC transporter permease, partial [Burkholderiales bacterium]|nr:branched-chain amino acid ABC transporter permease [Burkholderiales bacterium]